MNNTPKVFISSTVYDFKDIRSALKFYLEEHGYIVYTSESSDFKVDVKVHSYEACLNLIDECDYFILLIGSRVGGWYDKENKISITRQEYRHAYQLHQQGGLQILSFVRNEVWQLKETRNELTRYLENINNYDKEYYLSDLINEIITILQKDLLENNIEVISELNNEAKIYVDKNKFIQAIINILHNSIESFNKNKIVNRVIFIKLKQIDNDTQLEIKDNAGGIEESILSKIFEPYFTTNHQSQGKGLGLTNTYKIIVTIYKFLLSYSNCKITYKNKTYKGVCVTLTF